MGEHGVEQPLDLVRVPSAAPMLASALMQVRREGRAAVPGQPVARGPAQPDAAYDAVMRTTIDLPEDVHQAAVLVARDRHQTLSRAVSDLLRSALAGQGGSTAIEIDDETGLPLVRLRRRITAEDVASAQDDG